jgi:hypothetical protein
MQTRKRRGRTDVQSILRAGARETNGVVGRDPGLADALKIILP